MEGGLTITILDDPGWLIPGPPTDISRIVEFRKAIEELALGASLVPIAPVGSLGPGNKKPIRSSALVAVYVNVRLLPPLLNAGPIGPAKAWRLLRARVDHISLLQACTLLWAWLRRVTQEVTVNERVPRLVRVPGYPTVAADRRVERDHLLSGLHPTYAPPEPPDAPPPALRSAAFGPNASAALTRTLPGEIDKKTPV